MKIIEVSKKVVEKIKGSKIIKYNLYIGLNDKDTKKQEISTEKSLDIITKTLAKQGITDLTKTEGLGIYTHEDGTKTVEKSIIITMFFVEEIQISRAIVDIKQLLNQEAVILEKQKVNSKMM